MSDPIREAVQRGYRERARGDFDRARDIFSLVLQRDRANALAIKGLIDLSPDGAMLHTALTARQRHPRDTREHSILSFAIAKCLDDLGAYADSWSELLYANQIERAMTDYESEDDVSLMRGCAQHFPKLRTQTACAFEPIFIVGLPRSGSTLLERIISAHPLVHSLGEQPVIPDLIRALTPWNDKTNSPDFSHISPRRLQREYLARTEHVRRAGLKWTDKQLLNFCYVPQILSAFPKARFVNVTRSPTLASDYAIYRVRFPETWPFAYTLPEIRTFRSEYNRLLIRWRGLAAGHIMDVSYSDLVLKFESTVRDILEFLNLPFSSACLDFKSNPAPCNTMSDLQVRSDLYADALEHWRHYENFLSTNAQWGLVSLRPLT
jgi:hypothetical protein